MFRPFDVERPSRRWKLSTAIPLGLLTGRPSPKPDTRPAQKTKQGRDKPDQNGKLLFDALEPRFLLNGEILLVDNSIGAAATQNHALEVELVSSATTDSVQAAQQVAQVEIINQVNHAIVAEAPLDATSGIVIKGGGAKDALTVDTQSFSGQAAPPITFSGGGGTNQLTITGAGSQTWRVSGPNAGTVSGLANVSFTQVGTLVGGSNVDDTFVVTPRGALTGGVDGGGGGYDSLTFPDAQASTVTFNSTGAHSGSVIVNGVTTKYAGLSPVSVSGTVSNVIVNAPAANDQTVLETDPSDPGSLTFLSQNNMLESASFTLPANSLTVNLTGADDSLAIDNFASTSGASLAVHATAGGGSVDVTSGALISTRNTGGGDPTSAPSVGVSGSVAINAQTISVDNGASILTYGDSGFTGGVVNLSASATGAGASNQSASVTVDGATIKAFSLSISADVSQTAAVSSALTANADFTNNAAATIEGGSQIQTTAGVFVQATSAAGAGVTATALTLPATDVDAAVATAIVTSDATAEIGGGSVVTAGGAVKVQAGNVALIEIDGDGAPGGSTAGGATVGLGLVTTNTSATIDGGANVTAGGVVLVNALSNVFVQNTAIASAQGATANSANTQQLMMNNNATTDDGPVAVASAVAVTHLSQTTEASIDASGPISAAGLVSVAVGNASTVQTTADASTVFGGAGVGAAVAINAVNVDDEASISGETTISAPNVTVTSGPLPGTTDTFSVTALSGAGASPLGVAGALAINVVSDASHAYIDSNSALTFNNSGVLIGAGEATSATAIAEPGQSPFGPPDGIGASVAVNLIKTGTDAGVQQGASLGATSALQVNALASHTATTTAKAGATGGTATATAVALTDAGDTAAAHLDQNSVVNASKQVTLDADQSSTTTTTATGVVSGELSAVGAVVAIGVVSDLTNATSEGEIEAGGAVELMASGGVGNAILATSGTRGASASGANADGLIGSQLGYLGLPTTLAPSAATADGDFGVSAALGVGYTDDSISADQPSGLITAGGSLTLDASGVVAGVTAASAQPVNASLPGTGVATAVAINVGKETILADVDGTVAASGVTLDASPVDPGAAFGALAISGAGASDVGVAGAFALNVTNTQSNATIDSSAQVNAGGLAVLVEASNLTQDGADATAQLTASSPIGVGASVAIDIANTGVSATVAGGATVTNASLVRLTSTGGTGEITNATGGAAGGDATAASVALTYAQGSVTAQVASGASVTSAGAVRLQALDADVASTTAAAVAAGVNSAIGAVIAIGLVIDQTSATSAGEISAGGAVNVAAVGGVNNTINATATRLGASATGASANSAIGGQLGYLGLPTTLIPSAATADGAVGVAAALGVGYTNQTVSAQQSGGTITAGGALSLGAEGTAIGATTASGQSVNAGLPGVGVGAAVAINVGKQSFLADLDAKATAAGVSLTTLPVQPDVAFSATAYSGAGGTQVGVAGSLALNVGTTQSNALIDSGAQVDAGGKAVTLSASNQTSNTANAYSQVNSKSPVGVGASVAINIVSASVSASEVDGASLIDAGNVTFNANGYDNVTTNSIGGASGGTATAASVALTYAQESVTAQLQAGTQLTSSGTVGIGASHVSGATTTAAGVAAGAKTAVGATLAVGIVRDTTLADSSGALNAQGAVAILATGLTYNTVNSTAGVTGANPSGTPSPAEIASQLAFLGNPPGVLLPAVQTPDGGIGVSAALAVGVTLGAVTASETLGEIATPANVSLRALGGGAGESNANAQTINAALATTGIGGAVAVNVGDENVQADAESTINSGGLSLFAGPNRESAPDFTATADSGQSVAPVTVAGALAINVATTDAQAEVAPTANVDVNGGNVIATAQGGSQSNATATAQPSPSAKIGLGASVAVNVAFDTTLADIDGAPVDNANNVTLTATSNANASADALAGARALDASAAAISVNFADRNTTAEVTAGPQLNLSGTLTISASGTGVATSLADASDIGLKNGLGTAIGVDVPLDNVTAQLERDVDAGANVQITATSATAAGGGAIAGALGNSSGTPADTVIASIINYLNSGPAASNAPGFPDLAGDVASAASLIGLTLPSFEAAAAISANAAIANTNASIANGVSVTAKGLVSVTATGLNDALSSASSAASQSAGAIGLALGADYAQRTIQATVGQNAIVKAGTIVVLADVGGVQQATPTLLSEALAVSSASGAGAGAAASIALDLVVDKTIASVGNGATLVGTNGIGVGAIGSMTGIANSGATVNASAAGLGVTLALNLIDDQNQAFFGTGVHADSAGVMLITANETQTLDAESQTGSGGGDAEIPASISVNVLLAKTHADTGADDQLNQAGLVSSKIQSILINATDATFITGNAGVLGGHGVGEARQGALVGASADFGFVDKQTQADLGGTATAADNIIVNSLSTQLIASHAQSDGFNYLADLAGSAAVQMETLTTNALIDANANVNAGNNVVILSHDSNSVGAIADAHSVADAASAGAGIAAVATSENTNADVADDAIVNAQGEGAPINVDSGAFAISYSPASNAPGQVGRPYLPGALTTAFNVIFTNPLYVVAQALTNSTVSFLDISPINSIPDNPDTSQQRNAAPVQRSFSGLAVSALSQDDLETSGSGYGAAFGASPELSGAGVVIGGATSAFIGPNAQINLNRDGASATQSVLVTAGTDTFVISLAGTTSLAGIGAVGPAVTLDIIQPTTQAYIGAGAQVQTSTDVDVLATANEEAVGVATGVTAGAVASLAGSFPVVSIATSTFAYIDKNAVVSAPNNILVYAHDTTSSEPVAGVLSAGGAVGFGTSAAVTLIGKDTQAWIGAGAMVDAGGFGATVGERGNSSGGVIAINSDTSGSPFTTIHGLSVLANSSEQVTDLAVAGAPSLLLGIAGSVSVELIGNTTSAHVDKNAKINTSGAPASAVQTVAVGAYDDTETIAADAALSAGFLVQVGGAADLQVIRNNTSALVAQGVVINAAQDVNVIARSQEFAQSFAGGAGVSGLVGINGSVSAVSIGDVIGGELLDVLSSLSGPGTVQGTIDSTITSLITQGGDSLLKVLNNYAQGVGGDQPAATAMSLSTPNAPVTTAVISTVLPPGTDAAVVGATINAGRDVNVKARDNMEDAQDTSFTFNFSLFSSPLSINIDAGVVGGRANANAGVGLGATITAGRNINVASDADANQIVQSTYAFNSSADNSLALVDDATLKAPSGNVNVTANGTTKTAYSALLPGFSGLKLRLSYNELRNSIVAEVDDDSTVTASGIVSVLATDTVDVDVISNGCTLIKEGFLDFALAGSLAWNNVADTVSAGIDHSNVNAGSVLVGADEAPTLTAISLGVVESSDVAIGGGAAINQINNTVHAYISDGAVVNASGLIDVVALDQLDLTALAGAAAAVATVSVGAAFTYNIISDSSTAEINGANVTSTGSSVVVGALTTGEDESAAVGITEADSVTGDGSVPINKSSMTVTAQIVNSTVKGYSGVVVSATDSSEIKALAGSVVVSLGAFAAGAAVAENTISDQTLALISNSTVTSSHGNVNVTATATPEIDALAAGAGGSNSFSLAGSVSINTVKDSVEAKVISHSSLSANAINVTATDQSTIKSITGTLSIGVGVAAVSGSVSDNYVNDAALAEDSDSNLTSKTVTVKALSNPQIFALAAAGSASGAVSVEGAVTLNQIGSSTIAEITGAGAVITANTVTVTAQDEAGNDNDPGIQSIAAGISLGSTVGVGGSVAYNTISDTVGAGVFSKAQVNATMVTVTSIDDPDIKVLAGAVGAGGTVAVNASVATNTISDTDAALVDNATINASGATVMATSSPMIESLALVGGISGTVTAVASVTTNTIHSETGAAILGGSTISLGGGALTVNADDQSTIKSLSGAVGGSGTVAVAAAFAFDTIDSTSSNPSEVLASINGSTVNAGSVSVIGTYGASLLGVAISGSGAGTVAFGGSGVSNIDETTTNANVTNAKVTLPGALNITATDSSDVSGYAGNADGAGVASGGAAVVVNRIGNITEAQDLGGTSKVGAENVSASATGADNALAVSGAGAATAAGVFDDTENIVYDTVNATIGAGATVIANSVTLSAADSMTIMSLAGSAAGASAFAGSGAHAQNDIGATNSSRPSDILASIQGGALVNANVVALTGTFSGNIQSLAIGVSGAGGVTGDASIVDSVIDQPVGTQIIGGATHVMGTAVTLTTTDSSSIEAIAGAAEGSGIVAAGASITTSTINDSATATIAGATVTASGGKGNVSLSAQSNGQIEVFALAIGGSGVFSIQGAVDNNTMGSTTDATITGGAHVTAQSNVTLNADNKSQIKSLAVSVAGAGGAGIAGAVADDEIGNQTEAYITGSTVTATNGGVGVGASADGEIQALSAAVAGGILGVSGGVSINQIEQTIEAYVDQNSVVSGNSRITIAANDTATIKSLAGQAAGGFVGIGGAVAYNDITDTVQAYAQDGSTLTSNGDIALSAQATGTIETIAVGGSFGLVGVAGSVAVANLGDNVSAFTDNATVTTPHNVIITAVTTDSPEIWAGSLGVGFVGVAGTVAVETTSTDTFAYTKGGAITALGLGSAATVPIMDGQTGVVSTTTNAGLVITALNSETPSILSGTAAGGVVGVAGNVSVINVENFTNASIGGSTINSPSNPGAAVIVRAFQSTNVNVINGAAAVGIAGVAGAVSVIKVENSTSASITEAILTGSQERHETPASVTAKYVEITARGYENVTDGVVGVAGGLVGAAGSVSYVDVQNFTTAYVNTSVVDAIGGIGAIQVNSSDTTSISPTTGAVAGGFVGAAAGVSVNYIQNQTEANLNGAQLNATGAITIDATNTATIDGETVAGAGGAVGIGAAVAVNTIESTTETNFETPTTPGASPTLINQDPRFQKGGKFAVGAGQTVTAYANDTATIDSNEGALGAGIGAAGAAIDVDSIRDHVVTEAQVGTRISAAGNVSLTANSSRNASTNPLAISAGAVAIDGSITVINLGAELSSAAAAQFPSGVRSNVDSSLTPTTAGVNPNDGQAANAAQGGIDSVTPQGVDGELNPGAQDNAETAVILDSSKSNNVEISAGGSLTIGANNSYNVQVDAGSATGGLAGFGLAGAFVSITDNTLAQIGAQSQLIAGHNLTIGVSDTANGQSLIQVFAGAGALLGVAGSIGDVTLNLNVASTVGSHSVLDAGGTVSVTANQTSNISSQGLNFTFGLASVGAVDTDVTVQGTVAAQLGDHVFMGASQDRIGGLNVSATADNAAQVITNATTGGILVGGQTNSAIADVDPHITAEVGADDAIVASGPIIVNAASSGAASASADGADISGLGSLGESDAEATLAPIATAKVDTAAILSTLGAVTIEASQLVDGPQHQVSADSTAGGGAAGVAGNGALAIATSSGQAFASVLSQVQISAGGVVSALATAGNAGNASATGLNIGGIAADGGTHAEVDDNGGAQATFASNVTVSQANALNISAASADYGTAYTQASGGGLISLNGNAPDGAGSFVNLSPMVIATLGVADKIATSGNANLSAIDLAAGATDGEGTGIGGIDVGESIGQTTINPTVRAGIGSATTLSAGGNVNVVSRQGGPGGVINGHDLSVYNATGETTANANGSSGSLLGGGESTQATINVTGGLSSMVGAGAQVSAGQNITISTSFTFASNATGGSNSIGGFVSVGGTNADTTINLTNLAAVQASASLNAGGNATVSAAAAFSNDGSTSSDGGGGLAAGSSASTMVQIIQSTQANVGNGASITAGNNLSVQATSSYSSNVSSSSSAGGLGGSDAHAYSIYQVGDPSTGHQDPTTVFVGPGAVLTAPNTVNLTAIVQRWSANGAGSTSAGASGASAVTNVELDDLSLAQVTVAGQVTGDAALNVLAEQLHIGVGYNLSASATGLFYVHAASTLTYDHVVTSFILVPQGAVLETHALTLNAVVQELDPPVNDGKIGYNLTFDFSRLISFDGTAIILSSDPTLTIAGNGAVTADQGVNFSVSGGQIIVGDINDTTTGTVTFETSAANYRASPGATPTEVPSIIQGSKGSIVFVDTLSSVNIDNETALPLVLNGINPLDMNNDARVNLVGDLTPINFGVGVEFEPTQINIKSASSVTLDGTIDNPIGDTSITSLNGGVLAGAGAQIIGETVEINANGNIGSSSQPMPIVIVEGAGTAGLSLTAGQNVYIDLTGDLRTTASIADYVSNLSITAGGDINVTLEPGLDQTSVSGSPYGVTVGAAASTGGPTTNTHVYNHYHVDTGPPSPLPIGLFATGGATVAANYVFDTLSAGGNIVVSDPGPSINVAATTTLTGTGAVSVHISGDIDITEATGNLKLGSITSTGGAVSLSALAGDIVARGSGARVTGDGITLTASDGGIGGASLPIAIVLAGGALSASAANAIFITQTTGDMQLEEVDSASGNVTLAASNGSILDATGHSEINVTGRQITLTANGGSIGLPSDHLTASSYLGESGISATATGGVYLDDPPAPAHALLFDDNAGAFVSSSPAQSPQTMFDEAGAEWVVDGEPLPPLGDDLADWVSAA